MIRLVAAVLLLGGCGNSTDQFDAAIGDDLLVPADLARTSDLRASGDLALRDLAVAHDLTLRDLAMHDLAIPDLAMPDLAIPDLAMPPPDFAVTCDPPISLPIDSGAAFGNAVTVDAQGHRHLAYMLGENGRSGLAYASDATGQWVVETVDAKVDPYGSVWIMVDTKGQVHIVYSLIATYAKRDVNGKWTTSAISKTLSPVDAAIDGSGVVHVLVADTIKKTAALYTSTAEINWSTEVIDAKNAPAYSGASIALDGLGHPNVAYWSYSDFMVRVATRDANGNWSSVVVPDTFSIGPTDIAIRGGKTVVAYVEVVNNDGIENESYLLDVATSVNGVWAPAETIGQRASYDDDSLRVVIDASGAPLVLNQPIAANPAPLVFTRPQNGQWVATSIPTGGGSGGIAIGIDDQAIISYVGTFYELFLYETCPMGCVASCTNRQCGTDDCGGSCGAPCPSQHICAGNTCLLGGMGCMPFCGNKICGDDGCGGSCGKCAGFTYCDVNQLQCDPYQGGSCGDVGGLQNGAPWPMVSDCPSRQGRSPNAGPAMSLEKWSTAIGAWVDSSPVIAADGTSYVGTDSNFQHDLVAVDTMGAIKWRFTTGGYVGTSAAIGADGTIYIGSDDKNLYAVNPNGTQKWLFTTGGLFADSPVIGGDGTIYVSSNQTLFAVGADGKQKWSYLANGYLSSPAIAPDGTIYVGTSLNSHQLLALDPTGKLKWAYSTFDDLTTPSVGVDGSVYFVVQDANGSLLSVSSKGVLNWGAGVFDGSAPAIGSDGTIYTVAFNTFKGDTFLYAVHPNGVVAWTFDTKCAENSSAVTLGSDGVAYFGCGQTMFAVDSMGQQKWTFTAGDVIQSTPAIGSDGRLYFGSHDTKLHSIGP